MQQKLPEFVRLGPQIGHLVEHGPPGHFDDAAGDDLIVLTLGMNADHIDQTGKSHLRTTAIDEPHRRWKHYPKSYRQGEF